MSTTTQVRLADGPADGETITVELDVTGRPPLTHHWLSDRGLAGADIYELESTTEDGPWIYRWRGRAT
ncbi:hypothetical protein [Plantactinospora sp. KBS50]|uniref:hypothetical protein n=1 Tax=Plantactinospora sp. KBS50 TaxID=2024580 RepID=UPI000BAB16E6|nr:hypothetical protein [Plantactinospora sp. KBS50]ASW57886.1 hypothetical protein CIK06_21215 [Plantactinospora sp. KBS50]